MISAAVLRIDNSVLLDAAEIQRQRAKRGTGDGQMWRGMFSVPSTRLRPSIGESIQLCIEDDGRITAVVIEVTGPMVHFRANGLMPTPKSSSAIPGGPDLN